MYLMLSCQYRWLGTHCAHQNDLEFASSLMPLVQNTDITRWCQQTRFTYHIPVKMFVFPNGIFGSMHVCVSWVFNARGGQKIAIRPLKLELQKALVIREILGAETWSSIRVIGCFSQTSHFSIPYNILF